MNKRQGGCLCGDIRYEIIGEPVVVYYCHCRDCQRSTGSAFHVGLVLKQDEVRMLSGKPRGRTTTSDSGHRMTREFCPNCGSPLFTKDSGAPANLVIKAGSLDEPASVEPTVQIWTAREVPWAAIPEGIRSLEKGKAYQL